MAKPASPHVMVRASHGRSPRAGSTSRKLDSDGALEALGRVGLITFKDCERMGLVRSASRSSAQATSHRCAGETGYEC